MLEPVMQVGPAWAVPAALLLGVVALAGACFAGVLTARSEGRPALAGVSIPVQEAARLFRQRRRTTVAADVLLWRVGTGGLLVVALLKTAVVPLGGWTLADVSAGIVWFNAMDVIVWALIWLAGWGANSAYALVGGYRFLAQALSYELPLMFALTAPAIAAGSLRVGDVVAAQQNLWFVVWMPVAFLVFCAGVLAFAVWGPFAPAATSDISGGVLAELSGVDRFLALAGRYALLGVGAAFAVNLFLGGGAGPLAPPWVWMLVKTLLVLALLVAVARALPLARPDRLAGTAWIIVLPAVLVQLLVVSLIVVGV
jgi:NADH-quinone oxidoreductase subunit H